MKKFQVKFTTGTKNTIIEMTVEATDIYDVIGVVMVNFPNLSTIRLIKEIKDEK